MIDMDKLKTSGAVWGNERLQELIDLGMIRGTYEGSVNPASINLRLGHTFLKPKSGQIVMLGEEMAYDRYEFKDGQCVYIMPGEFMLATTIEAISVPIDAAAFVQGRSSIGRVGLTVQNAGFVDPGFPGHITLELKNDSPCVIVLFPGYPVAQLVYIDANGVTRPYRGKYVNQTEATGSRMQMDNLTPENVFAKELR